MKINKPYIIFVLISFLTTACSTTTLLNEGEYLYKGANIHIESKEEVKSKSIKKQLNKFTTPRPNRKFAGLFPLKLWMYNLAGDSVPSKGFRHWLKYKAGEPPVRFKHYYIEASKNELGNALQNRGYFNYEIDAQKKANNQKMTVNYDIVIEAPYKINTINYPEVTDSLTHYISKYESQSLIKKKKQYKLQKLEEERKRIDKELKKEGFFYFSPEFLSFKLDTFSDTRLINVTLNIKRSTPEKAKRIYYINEIFIHHNYSADNSQAPGDTLFDKGIKHIYRGEMNMKSSMLARSVFFKTGEKYNIENYNATLNKLIGLGIYKFVNIHVENDRVNRSQALNVHIYLTNSMPKSLRAELLTVSKSNDFVGPGINLSYRNRNLNKGAESFLLNINSGFETQFSKKSQRGNLFEAGIQSELNIPRIISPFFDANRFLSKKYTPETRIRAGCSYFSRSNYFTANTLNLSYGYRWKETLIKTHDLDILSINYLEINNVDESIKDSYLFNRNLREQFIFAVKYMYTFNNLLLTKRKVNTYFSASAESAGHTLDLVDGLFIDTDKENNKPVKILGVAYSQYVRMYADYRTYVKFSERNKLVSRIYAGIGLPYRNSDFLPYRKQFYSGGTSSLRAFPTRSVGPGAYSIPDSLEANLNFEQAGDIKLEFNLEYRFDIIKLLKGALFMDAGNVWLSKNDDQLPGGKFKSASFLSEMAIGTGVGIRLDASFFVLRLDVAFPVRKPSLPFNERWVVDNIDILDSKWRQDNLIFNVAIGYPF